MWDLFQKQFPPNPILARLTSAEIWPWIDLLNDLVFPSEQVLGGRNSCDQFVTMRGTNRDKLVGIKMCGKNS